MSIEATIPGDRGARADDDALIVREGPPKRYLRFIGAVIRSREGTAMDLRMGGLNERESHDRQENDPDECDFPSGGNHGLVYPPKFELKITKELPCYAVFRSLSHQLAT